MQSTDPVAAREAEIKRIARSATDRAAVEKHLNEIVEGVAFRGSQRSGQFLRYILKQAMAEQFSSLKERVIAMELFGRDPSYDNAEDAIVRVTASDVRKRLQRHYDQYGSTSAFRIGLPLGSYVPEITRLAGHGEAQAEANPADALHGAPPAEGDGAHAGAAPGGAGEGIEGTLLSRSSLMWLRWRFAGLGALSAGLLLGTLYFLLRPPVPQSSQLPSELPWSAFLNSPRNLHLITSDPNIAEIRGLLHGTSISVSDYANHQYIPEPNTLSPDVLSVCQIILRGDKCPNIDASLAAGFSEFLGAYHKHIDVRGARTIQLSDLRNDDNFIILGSPRTNPWSQLFSDQLGFHFVLDKGSHSEHIENLRPRSSEEEKYTATASGWATGQSYALIALVQNPDQSGQVLLLAGETAEGTEAAGNFIRDSNRLGNALRQCEISNAKPVKHFEMLLRLNMMAGAPNHIEMAACHVLPAPASAK